MSTTGPYIKDPQTEKDPFQKFEQWFRERIRTFSGELYAAALSTAGNDGRVSSRMVLVKNFGRKGFVFFTNYESRKGLQILENPFGSLLYYWPEEKRQVRIEGFIEKTGTDISDAYFNSRPPGSRISAVISSQSREISSRAELEEKFLFLMQNTRESAPSRPSGWGGYCLVPQYFEFWQEMDHRLHERTFYELKGTGWRSGILAP